MNSLIGAACLVIIFSTSITSEPHPQVIGHHTPSMVDDMNPALARIRKMPEFPWFRVLEVMQEFYHQQYDTPSKDTGFLKVRGQLEDYFGYWVRLRVFLKLSASFLHFVLASQFRHERN